MDLSVRISGVGDAFTTRYHHASLIVEAGSTRLMVDAPPAMARMLADLGGRGGPPLSLDDIDQVLVTHLHGDHVGGLEQWLFQRRFVTRRPCTILAIPAVLAGLWEGRLRGGMATLLGTDGVMRSMTLEDYATLVPLAEGVTQHGDLAIGWRPTIHHVPTSALRLSAGGRSVGYSADTAYDPGLIAWLATSDLVIHETNLGVHTPLARLMEQPAELQARMRLIHYPDCHDPDTSPLACAREGDVYRI
jgi:ribonuclease BN (tRNA processing enzyme)